MRRLEAAAASALFFVCAPGVVAGVIPWWLTGWDAGHDSVPLQMLGLGLAAAGAAALLHAFGRFVVDGLGTPAPVAPTESLVVGGLYRYVRNPMYLAVLAVVFGQALAFGRAELALYALALAVAFAAFVRWYEEPALARRFGAQYEDYRASVPAWLPLPVRVPRRRRSRSIRES